MSMSQLKILGINLIVFFVLFNLLYWSVPTLPYLWMTLAPLRATDDPRGRQPNYANVNWARQHYREYHQLKTDYKSFIGWHLSRFTGRPLTSVVPARSD
jgi:hypothetical protein